MAERSFAKEVELLRNGEGTTLHVEGILAVTKALLQSGVAYVGGYQGAPISHLMDVLGDSREILEALDVSCKNSPSEATAAAMLAASVHYPMRGAVTFKSTVGLNVASDALANLASGGVTRGARLRPRAGLRRGHRRRPRDPRRGLRRGLLDHAGALSLLRDEVADVAARPAPERPGDRR